MRPDRSRVLILALLALLASGVAGAAPIVGLGTWEATLQARDIDGNGTVDAFYDTVLDITWLADANAGAGSAFDSSRHTSATDGRMNWGDARAWAAGLDVHGLTGWRLPKTLDTGRPGCDWSSTGGTDCGYEVQTISADGKTVYSEMAHLYYVTLGNVARCVQPFTSCVQRPGGGGAQNTALFVDVDGSPYWSGSTVANLSPAAFSFDFGNGIQDGHTVPLEFHAWAVRDGDVPRGVPEPALPLLVLAALGAAAAASRRRPR